MEVTATAMLPYDDAARARSLLRTRLQDIVESRQIPEAALAGARMLVAGPTEVVDAAGRTWFHWVAALKTRRVARVHPRRDDHPNFRPAVSEFGLLRPSARAAEIRGERRPATGDEPALPSRYPGRGWGTSARV